MNRTLLAALALATLSTGVAPAMAQEAAKAKPDLAKAKQLGVLQGEVEALADEQLLRVLARAGFSTAERVSAVSGRGMGIL